MDENIIEVEIEDIVMTNAGFAMIFYDKTSNRVLPIFIGPFEANGIIMKLQGAKFPRPLTYDLIKNMLDSLGAYVEKVIINDLRDRTFYATLYINFQGNIIELDSRPSDAVAIAVRYNSPIYVAQHVMDISSVSRSEYMNQGYENTISQELMTPKTTNESTTSKTIKSQKKDKKEVLLEELQKELEKAVAEERYEDAARIRDEINKLNQSTENE
ncbi:MAG: bifunctional nuclease family protein [Brevinematales bacterium]|nr:bifunctional nuclease family protein [Brevinematales bacterium]